MCVRACGAVAFGQKYTAHFEDPAASTDIEAQIKSKLHLFVFSPTFSVQKAFYSFLNYERSWKGTLFKHARVFLIFEKGTRFSMHGALVQHAWDSVELY